MSLVSTIFDWSDDDSSYVWRITQSDCWGRGCVVDFHAACAQHDYCYRYGHATYGRSKYDCDRRFLDHMKEICQQVDWRTLVTPGYNATECRAAADVFYAVVRNSDKAEKAYQRGTLACNYEGFCPPGKFETTGRLHGCKCPVGHKVYTGIAKETAYCSGSVQCPSGRFATTGQYRGCECPAGSHKVYLDVAKAGAACTTSCPSGEFKTTGAYKGCACPEGKRKDYLDIVKYQAKCVSTDGRGGGGGGTQPGGPPSRISVG